ncbi:MAG: class A beta-lactamase-related serine hydrolase [Acidobacteria bacterium]|nr:MAG: class A beta-lactamase-related serine hydrolase [Acidobacteriota bacterium]REK11509.1 MAG: class A beta-lactamase-related serine hydrolase [Acidobacteriota bacterium]
MFQTSTLRTARTACSATTLVLLALSTLATSPVGATEGSARDLAMVEPSEVGLDPAKVEKFTSEMKKLVDDGQLAGMVTMIARHGKIAQFEAFGYRDLEKKLPMEKDTIVRIYSMSKPVTGVALMILYDEGKFQLDDPVSKYLPQFADLKVAKADGPDGMPELEEPHHAMTIRELMSHTGGLTYGFFSRSQTDQLYVKANILDRDTTLEQMVDKLGQLPLRQQPGSAWHYSVSVDVQGRLIEVLSGKPFDVFLKERIFEPLGMKDTDFWVPEEKLERFSRLYVPNRDGVLEVQPEDEYLTKPTLLSGGGGMVSTAIDYMRFAQMLLNGGELDGVRILKPETVELMHQDHLPEGVEFINPLMGNPGNKFGLDFALVHSPDGTADHELAKGEYWWYGIGGTWFGINPVQDIVVVGMIQARGGLAARQARIESKKLAYEAIVDPVEN